MPRFSVLVSGLENECSKLNAIKGELLTYASRINSVKSSLPIYGNSAAQIKTALEKSRENVNRLSEKTQLLSDNLNKAGYAYTKVEKSSDGNSDIENEKLFETNKSSDTSFIDNTILQFLFLGLIDIIRKLFNGKHVSAYEVDSIVFDDSNKDNNKYGGKQHGPMYADSTEKEEIKKIVLNNLPDDANLNDSNFEKYLKKLNNEGCEYTALVNTIAVYFVGKEDQFYQEFGYPLYNQKTGDINYNLILADLYSSIDNRKNGKYDKFIDYNEKDDGDINTYDHWSDDTGLGTHVGMFKKEFTGFMKEHNINSKINTNYGKTITADTLKKCTENGESVIISRHGGCLYKENGEVQQELYDKNGNEAGHAMVITGITEDGRYIVSSWGKKLYLKPDEGSSSKIYSIKYSER